MNKTKSIIWGFIFIVLGIIIGLNFLEIIDVNLFFNGWYTLFIIVPALVGLITEDDKLGNLICLIIGVFLLIGIRGIVNYEILIKLLLPSILIVFGLSMVFKDVFKKEKVPNMKNESEYTVTFSKLEIDFTNEDFFCAELNSIFGKMICDLSNAIIKDKSVINCCSLFGRISLNIPKDTKVVIENKTIFGKISNKHSNNNENDKTIYINALCLFGGLEINDK